MLTLGVETSGHCAAVALLRDEQILAEVSLMEAGRPRSNRLVSAVREMLAAQGCAVEALDVLAVGHGPGSFTGLRVGIVFAKTLAYITGKPVIGVPTFAAVVQPLPADWPVVEVVEDLRQGRVASQEFRQNQDRWVSQGEIAVETLADWSQRERSAQLLTGPGLSRLERQLPGGTFPVDWNIAPASAHHATAPAIARLGFQLFNEQGPTDPFQLAPLYIRPSAAEEQAQNRKQTPSP